MMEKSKRFGGPWTEQKLDTFIAYVKAYLTIMNKQKQRWKTIYFDGFAGAGERIQKGSIGELKFEFVYSKTALEDLGVFRGSIKRILELPQPYWFDWYYFVDIDPEATESIKKLVEETKPGFADRIQIRQSDCNEQLIEMANKALKSGEYAALVFLDPFGMQVKWESIAALKNTRSDVWLLLPSGVAINRLLPRKGAIQNPQKLETFFGLSIDAIRDIFYTRRTEPSLFGAEIIQQ